MILSRQVDPDRHQSFGSGSALKKGSRIRIRMEDADPEGGKRIIGLLPVSISQYIHDHTSQECLWEKKIPKAARSSGKLLTIN